jgi:LCP family protein required for cell wall assembly
MPGTSVHDFFSRQAQEARGPEPERPARRKSGRARKLRRIALASVICLAVVAGGVVGAGYLVVSHLASSVHRIHVVALTAPDQPVMPAKTRRSITILVTGDATLPAQRGGSGVDGSSTAPEAMSGLIALVHLNASDRGGAIIDLPPNAEVEVPGFGRMELWSTLKLGGPSLLIKTVEHLTNVRVTDYSVVDFSGLRSVVGAMSGVNIDAPFTMKDGKFTFPKGIDHLNAADVLPYVRQLDVSEIGREELESGLMRSVLAKIARKKMFSHVHTDIRVLKAMSHAFSVDSDMSDSRLESLGLKLGFLKGRDATFVTAPTNGSPLSGGDGAVLLENRIARKLWSAIRHDSVAAFARRYPFTVTPGAPA